MDGVTVGPHMDFRRAKGQHPLFDIGWSVDGSMAPAIGYSQEIHFITRRSIAIMC